MPSNSQSSRGNKNRAQLLVTKTVAKAKVTSKKTARKESSTNH